MKKIDFTTLRAVDAYVAESFFGWQKVFTLGAYHLVPSSDCSPLSYSCRWKDIFKPGTVAKFVSCIESQTIAESSSSLVPAELPEYTKRLHDAGLLLSELSANKIYWNIAINPRNEDSDANEYFSFLEVGDRQFRLDAIGININSICLSIVTGFLFVKGVEATINGLPLCLYRKKECET